MRTPGVDSLVDWLLWEITADTNDTELCRRMQANTWNNNLVKELDCDLKAYAVQLLTWKNSLIQQLIWLYVRKVRDKMAVNKRLLLNQFSVERSAEAACWFSPFYVLQSGLLTLCFKRVWKLYEVLNLRVTGDHRPAQAQEGPAGWGPFFRFCPGSQNFFCKIESKCLNSRGMLVVLWRDVQKNLGFKHI